MKRVITIKKPGYSSLGESQPKLQRKGFPALNALDLPGDVGYLTRFEKQMQSQTPIVVATYGILLRRLLKDPLIEDIGILILDEFPERTREMDLLLVHLRELLELRDDLKVIVMSATIEVVSLQKYLTMQLFSIYRQNITRL